MTARNGLKIEVGLQAIFRKMLIDAFKGGDIFYPERFTFEKCMQLVFTITIIKTYKRGGHNIPELPDCLLLRKVIILTLAVFIAIIHVVLILCIMFVHRYK